MGKELDKYTVLKTDYACFDIKVLGHNIYKSSIIEIIKSLSDVSDRILVINLDKKTIIGLKSWLLLKEEDK